MKPSKPKQKDEASLTSAASAPVCAPSTPKILQKSLLPAIHYYFTSTKSAAGGAGCSDDKTSTSSGNKPKSPTLSAITKNSNSPIDVPTQKINTSDSFLSADTLFAFKLTNVKFWSRSACCHDSETKQEDEIIHANALGQPSW